MRHGTTAVTIARRQASPDPGLCTRTDRPRIDRDNAGRVNFQRSIYLKLVGSCGASVRSILLFKNSRAACYTHSTHPVFDSGVVRQSNRTLLKLGDPLQ